jgi:phospholipase C
VNRPRRAWWLGALAILAPCLGVVVACGGGGPNPKPPADIKIKKNFHAPPEPSLSGIHKIRHIVIIMQENRSFDSYFGTFPGADGLPMRDGQPAACVPDPAQSRCVTPYHDPQDRNAGGPHGHADATADIDGGRMDGFIAQQELGRKQSCKHANDPSCVRIGTMPEVMGYHDAREIPNYWTYARQFVLQDHMFEPNASWSLPAHLFLVSEWSARCSKAGDPMSCVNALQNPAVPTVSQAKARRHTSSKAVQAPDYAWTDLTYLLHQHRIS